MAGDEGFRLERKPVSEPEVLKWRLDRMDSDLSEVKEELRDGLKTVNEKIDKHHLAILERFATNDTRANGQLIVIIMTLVTALGTLALKLLHP